MIQKLEQNWQLKCMENGKTFPAVVPGTVYEVLIKHGEMPDPFVGDHEKYGIDKMMEDYEYSCLFDVNDEVWNSDKKELVFEGIDTIADIYLNGRFLASVNNMHRTWRFFDDSVLKHTGNELRIHLYAPIPYIRNAYAKCRTDGSPESMQGFPLIRKGHYMFGWDWGPHLPDAGVFRTVYLKGINGAGIKNVLIHQEHRDGSVFLTLNIEKEISAHGAVSYELQITAPDGSIETYHDFTGPIEIKDPCLWWPNGFGKQNLYQLELIQFTDHIVTDSYTSRIGLRTIEIHREKDEWGESFCHRVNGVDIFAMGADYIPEDNLLGRLTPERTSLLLKQCKDCNFNTIRVWGGGIYPPDWFFDLCDEYGLLVWQDLMFACAVYELDDDFEENISQEIIDNLIRFRNHPCLALICGNNEMEMFVHDGLWVSKPKQQSDYVRMYEHIFPKLLHRYAPDLPYWPASPSSGGAFDEPNDYNRGDTHYWSVWHNSKPFSDYRNYYFRYLSEFGFQSVPSIRTIQSFAEKDEDMNLFSYCMDKHQRNANANAKIMQYMGQTYLYPTSFEMLIYASQLLQGDAIRYGVEHFRRNRGRCMGAIYWQLNDCWPVISWSSIDYFGRWKALQYYAKRFFAPVLLSCEETGMMTENHNINGENKPSVPSVRFNVSNETMKEKHVIVEWELRNANDGSIVHCHRVNTLVAPLGVTWLEKTEIPDADIFTQYVSYRLIMDQCICSEGSVLFSYPKYFHFADPKLNVTVEGNIITVESAAYAKSVEILDEKEDLILSDNFFDMNPGKRSVKILHGKIQSLRVRSVYDIR